MTGYTQAQLDALKKAYASGVKIVKHGDNMVTYADLGEMAKAIDKIEASLNRRSRVFYPDFDRGT
jgi:hypothetical protein